MPLRKPGAEPEKGVVSKGQDTWQLVVDYAKQETVEPLKGLGRWIGFGAGGSLLIAFGVGLLLLAALRALQTETGTTFTGNWSWAPYLIVLVGAAAVVGLSVWAINRSNQKKKGSDER